ncbi:zf-HC2 domain-containing protein [Butyrivibrio sp. AE2015]|uniref:zf-HC2 domain-containing protein n=2 Tax=Butyrivibrio TaxID=830 RepID=UPI0003B474F6|nr:zf-HC2 domain-containing protein [Butyrivibrio sp. AE2015]
MQQKFKVELSFKLLYFIIMTCKEAEKLIPLFLDDDLDNKDLAEFIEHIDNCPECKEELTIQFLVKTGMQRLEDGNTFNLKQELLILIKDAKKRLKFRRNLFLLSILLELAVVVLVVTVSVLAFAL